MNLPQISKLDYSNLYLGIKEFLKHNDTTRGNMISTVVLAYGKLEELFKTFDCTKSLSKYFKIPIEDDRIRLWIEYIS